MNNDGDRPGTVVLSAGMQSSGSGWFFNLTDGLLTAAGSPSVRALRDQHGLHDILHAHNCNVRSLTPERWDRLVRVADEGPSFVVKSHEPPTPTVGAQLATGRLKALYIYRDPRDVVASAWDRGKTRRSRGNSDSFARLRTVPHAVVWMRLRLLPVFEAWHRTDGAMLVRYEDLRSDPLATTLRIRDYLGLDLDDRAVEQVVSALNPAGGEKKEGTHYRAGNEKRRSLLSPWQVALCNRAFAGSLTRMGYGTRHP